MWKRTTVAMRICMNCGEAFGVALWAWNGEAFTRTHGLCRRCFERLDAAFEEERRTANRPRRDPYPGLDVRVQGGRQPVGVRRIPRDRSTAAAMAFSSMPPPRKSDTRREVPIGSRSVSS